MSLTFRRAQPEDMGLLLSLIKELARYEHLEREVTATEEILSETTNLVDAYWEKPNTDKSVLLV